VSLKAVLFDAGNTLLFLDFPRLAPAVERVTGVPLTAAGLRAQAAPAARMLERRDGTDRERATRYLETLFRLAGVPDERMPEVRDELLALHQERHLWGAMDPGTPAALERLRAAGFRLAVISNSDGRASEGLAAAGLLDFFELVVDSALVGLEKPDPGIFTLTLKQMGLDPSETLYVGDLYEVDVAGARAAGLDVILLDPLGVHAGRDVRTAASVAAVAELLLGDSRLKAAESAAAQPAT